MESEAEIISVLKCKRKERSPRNSEVVACRGVRRIAGRIAWYKHIVSIVSPIEKHANERLKITGTAKGRGTQFAQIPNGTKQSRGSKRCTCSLANKGATA